MNNNQQSLNTYIEDVRHENLINESDDKSQTFDTSVFVVDMIKGLRKFWSIVLILAILSGAGAYLYKHNKYVPMYQSSVSFSVSATAYSVSGNTVFSSYYDNASASQLAKSFPYIINTSLMSNALKRNLNTTQINGTVTAEPVSSNSNIFKMTVKSNSAQDAYNIVNAVIDVYPSVAQYVLGNISLTILIKPVLAQQPYTTDDTPKITVLAALAGAAVGVAFIAAYAFFRKTIKKKDDIKNKLNKKCLVEIPYVERYRKSKDKKPENELVRITGKHPFFKESFRTLRKRVIEKLDGNVLAVTGAVQGEGKTAVALNLAHAMAKAGKKTVLIDMDIKKRSLQKYIAKDTDYKGITEIFDSDSNDYEKYAVKEDDNLYIYFAGNTQMNFSKDKFIEFMTFLRSHYDYVVVDTPPGGLVSDAIEVCNHCDGILFVIKQDRTSIDKIRQAIELLSYSNAKIIGVAFNGVREGFSGYGGYYYGGKYGYGKYGYGKYGYGKYGYGKSGYGKYGYGRRNSKHGYGYGSYGSKEKEYGYGYSYGYGYGYGYGDDDDDNDERSHRSQRNSSGKKAFRGDTDSDIKYIENVVNNISSENEDEIPDNNS